MCVCVCVCVRVCVQEEYCYIPMGGELPDRTQRVIAFAGAANTVHPSIGYASYLAPFLRPLCPPLPPGTPQLGPLSSPLFRPVPSSLPSPCGHRGGAVC